MRKNPDNRRPRKSITLRNEENILLRSAQSAGSDAARSSRALGLTVKIIKDHQIISVNPDMTENLVRAILKLPVDTSKLRKGYVLRKKII